MSFLLLLMLPPVALAGYRILAARGVATAPAVAAAAIVSIVVTAGPAIVLRPKPSTGRPTETPVGPAFARTTAGSVDLLVDFTSGWSDPELDLGRTVRRMNASGRLTIGSTNATRPPATLSFVATTNPPSRLAVRLSGDVLAGAEVTPQPTLVRASVPGGRGPASLDVVLASGGVVTVWLDTVRATAVVTR